MVCLRSDAEEFVVWKRGSEHAISSVFGNDSKHRKDFRRIRFAQVVFAQNYSSDIDFFQYGLDQAKTILESMLDEIEDLWPDASPSQPVSDSTEALMPLISNSVFVVHGRNGGTKNEVARFLERLGLEVVILHERPNEGRTVIEKFEDYADVGFAVVLCTPDDVGALVSDRENLQPRPRQNVNF